jgi:hypothetical protein
VLSSLAWLPKWFGKNQEIAKVSYVIASLFVVLFSIAVIRQDSFAIICVGLAGFGFFGLAAYPMAMELAVEASYPIDFLPFLHSGIFLLEWAEVHP